MSECKRGRFVLIRFAALLALSSAASAQLADYPGSVTDHGSVRVQLIVDTAGQIVSCTVIRPTNIASLDAAACPFIRQTLHFNPGTDKNGKPEAYKTELSVHYITPHVPQTAADLPILPHDPLIVENPGREVAQKKYGTKGPGLATPARRIVGTDSSNFASEASKYMKNGQVVALIDVGTDGTPAGCSVVRTSGSRSLDQAACKYAVGHFKYRPGTDYYGNPVVDEDVFAVSWATSDD
jgi:TonB family protein